jgi:hypothetical protein
MHVATAAYLPPSSMSSPSTFTGLRQACSTAAISSAASHTAPLYRVDVGTQVAGAQRRILPLTTSAADEFRKSPAADEFRKSPAADEFRKSPAADEFRKSPAADEFRKSSDDHRKVHVVFEDVELAGDASDGASNNVCCGKKEANLGVEHSANGEEDEEEAQPAVGNPATDYFSFLCEEVELLRQRVNQQDEHISYLQDTLERREERITQLNAAALESIEMRARLHELSATNERLWGVFSAMMSGVHQPATPSSKASPPVVDSLFA